MKVHAAYNGLLYRRYERYTLETVQTLTINPIRKKMSFNVVFLKAGLDKIKQI